MNADDNATVMVRKKQVYSPVARFFHWLTVLLVAIMFPLGIIMSERAEENIWDATTNTMFSTHKLLGFIILLLIICRLTYRLVHGAPDDEPTLEPWQKLVSHLTHWALYGLLLLVPLVGWFGVQLFPALDVFGWFSLPAVVSPNEKAAEFVFEIHEVAAFALLFLIAMHIGAALFHYFIRKDGVLNRMWTSLPRRDR